MVKSVFGIAAISVALSAWLPQRAPTSSAIEGNSFTISDVRIFDGAQTTARASIVVRNGLIEAVGARVNAPKDSPFIDGAGKTLIPGLIDAHTHNARDETLFDAVRFGVTTELNMSSSVTSVQNQRPRRGTLGRVALADLWSAGTPATAPGGLGTAFGYPSHRSRRPQRRTYSFERGSPRAPITSRSFTTRGKTFLRFLEKL